jgi:hypothetical protein
MLVNVIGYACSGDRTLIHAEIESLRVRDFSQNFHGVCGELSHLTSLLNCQFGQLCDMAIGTNQKMTRVIRIEIEDNVIMLRASNDKSRFIITGWDLAEGATDLIST